MSQIFPIGSCELTFKYSAVVPSRNRELIDFCVEALEKNSLYCSEILVIWNGRGTYEAPAGCRLVRIITPAIVEVYSMFNEGVALSRETYSLLINDDMYVPSGWDRHFPSLADPSINPESSIFTFDVVEPGYVAVDARNLPANFGMTVNTFNRKGFEAFAAEVPFGMEAGTGWYMPVIFPRELFLRAGGFPTDPPFPMHPHDIDFFAALARDPGSRFVRLHSRVYHFQCHSQRKTLARKRLTSSIKNWVRPFVPWKRR